MGLEENARKVLNSFPVVDIDGKIGALKRRANESRGIFTLEQQSHATFLMGLRVAYKAGMENRPLATALDAYRFAQDRRGAERRANAFSDANYQLALAVQYHDLATLEPRT